MNNFEFYNPVRIVFGKETIARLADLISADKKTMMVYGGGSIKRNGVYDQVKKALAGRRLTEFAGIEPNPQHETCMKAVAAARKDKVDFLLAVGGGSVLDATKYIAVALRYPGADPWDILQNHGQTLTDAVPMGAVLTLPATGSEMNGNSVISREQTREKLHFASPLVFPLFSILDPEVIRSLPLNQIRNGIVDAFVHVVEQLVTYDVQTPLQDRQAMAVLSTLVQLAPELMASNQDYDLLASFMWSATHALNEVLTCGTVGDWSTHMIGHELTALYGMAHAESLAIVLPGVWEHQLEQKKGKLAWLGAALWNVVGSQETCARAAIARTEEFFHSVTMPTRLGDYHIGPNDLKKVNDRFAQRGMKYGEHQDLGPKQIAAILNMRL